MGGGTTGVRKGGTLLNILQCIGQLFTAKADLSENVSSPKARISVLNQWLDAGLWGSGVAIPKVKATDLVLITTRIYRTCSPAELGVSL